MLILTQTCFTPKSLKCLRTRLRALWLSPSACRSNTCGQVCAFTFLLQLLVIRYLVIFSFLCTDVSTFSSHLTKDDGHELKAGENSALNVKVEEKKKPIWIKEEKKKPVIISVCAWGDLSACPRTPYPSSPDSLTLMTWKWFCWME